jgi:hypothetical protein
MMLVQQPIMRIFTGMGSPLKAAPARHVHSPADAIRMPGGSCQAETGQS